jgi:hypothetical protein
MNEGSRPWGQSKMKKPNQIQIVFGVMFVVFCVAIGIIKFGIHQPKFEDVAFWSPLDKAWVHYQVDINAPPPKPVEVPREAAIAQDELPSPDLPRRALRESLARANGVPVDAYTYTSMPCSRIDGWIKP